MKYIGLEAVIEKVNRKRAWIYAQMKLNKFPKKRKLGWLESEIDDYMLEIANEGQDGCPTDEIGPSHVNHKSGSGGAVSDATATR